MQGRLRILVTGGRGFLGQALTRRLRNLGHEVRSYNRSRNPDLDRAEIEQIQGDLRDGSSVDAACKGMDLVFHVAAKTGIWGNYREYFHTNVLGTRNVISACLNQGIGYLIHTSSPSVAYNQNSVEGADESLPFPASYLTHYQKTKFLAEQEVLQASERGLNTIILRPRLIWGPGDNQLVPRIIARAKRLVQVGNGRNLVDTVYIDNAAEAHVLAAEKLQQNPALSGKTYFISQGEPVCLWQMINDILAAAGKPPVTRSVPAGVAYAAGGLLEVIYKLFHLPGEPGMTRFLAYELSQAHWFDIRAARRDLEYAPRVSIAEGLQRLKVWLAEQR